MKRPERTRSIYCTLRPGAGFLCLRLSEPARVPDRLLRVVGIADPAGPAGVLELSGQERPEETLLARVGGRCRVDRDIRGLDHL